MNNIITMGRHTIRIEEDCISIYEIGEGYSICVDMNTEKFEKLIKAYQKHESNNSNVGGLSRPNGLNSDVDK